MKKLLSLLTGLALVAGLMPAGAFAHTGDEDAGTGALAASGSGAFPAPLASDAGRTTVRPEDIDDVLVNPGKGWWAFVHDATSLIDWNYDGDPACAGTDKFWGSGESARPDYSPVVGIGYRRYSWSEVEPEPGVFNWAVLDEAIESLDAVGKQFAFGIMSADSLSSEIYITPKWVFDEGAASKVVYEQDQDGNWRTQYLPVWTDPIFLSRQRELIAAMGERYNGDPRIAFIDIRSYGNWGEQHLSGLATTTDPDYVQEGNITPDQLRDLYIEPFRAAFTQTQLVNVYGLPEYEGVYEWAVEQGISIRRDGILGTSGYYDEQGKLRYWTDGHETAVAAGKLPSIFEFGDSYATMKRRGLGQWNTDYLTECVNRGKPSYMWLFYDMYRENKEYCDRMANRLGYWLRLRSATFDRVIAAGDPTEISITFANDGVAPIFRPNASCLALLDDAGKVAARCTTDWNAFDWKPDAETEETAAISFDAVSPGTYRLAYGLLENAGDELPTYLLGSEGKTDDKWYVLGDVEVRLAREPYASVSDMVADSTLAPGNVVQTEAYRAGGPTSGAGRYAIERHDDWGADRDDAGSCIQLRNGLWAKLAISGDAVDLSQFGAVGDGVADDASCLQAAVNAASAVHVGKGAYALGSAVSLRTGSRLSGDGFDTSTFTCVPGDPASEAPAEELISCPQNSSGISIRNVGFSGLGDTPALGVDAGVSGLEFHTTQPLYMRFDADPSENDVLVDATLDVVLATSAGEPRRPELLNGRARLASGYAISWQDESGGAWSHMSPCADGFTRRMTISVPAGAGPARLSPDTTGAPGSIAWAGEHEVEPGATFAATLVCQEGVWHEMGPGLYDSVSSLRADRSLADGDTAITLAYRRGAASAGAGTYRIEAHDDWEAGLDDGGSRMRLENGLWAVLQVEGGAFHVRQFGAAGDGANDDTESLANALAFAGSRATSALPATVNLGSGDYLIAHTLSIPSNTAVVGDGASACRIVAGGDWLRSDVGEDEQIDGGMIHVDWGVSNARLEGVFIDANVDVVAFKNEIEAAGGTLWGGSGQWSQRGHPSYYPLGIFGAENVVVRDCRIANTLGTGVQIMRSSSLTFDGCEFSHLEWGVSVHWQADIGGLAVNGCTFDGFLWGEAVSLMAEGSYKDIVITGNRIRNKPNSAGILLDGTGTFENVNISGNAIEACQGGIDMSNASGTVEVSGNRVEGATTALRMAGCAGVHAADNAFAECAGDAIVLDDCRACRIEGLSVRGFALADAGSTGVRASGDGSGTTVAGTLVRTAACKASGMTVVSGTGYDLSGLSPGERITKVTLGTPSATYDGSAHKPTVKAVAAGSLPVPASSASSDYPSGYSVAYLRGGKSTTDFTSAGAITVKVTGRGDFAGTKSVTFTIGKAANPMTATAKKPSNLTFKTSAQTLARPLTVSKARGAVTYGIASQVNSKNGKVRYFTANKTTGKITVAKSTPTGSYKVGFKAMAAGDGNHRAGSVAKTIAVKVSKAANPMKVKAKAPSVGYSKSKARKLAASKSFAISNAKGKVTFKKSGGDAKVSINKSGKVTVAKAAKRGKHTIRVNVTAAGTANYAAKTVKNVKLAVTVQ